MKRIAWDIREPSHFEVDLVHQSGESSAGEYGHTLQLIDVATGWSERVMLLGRGYQAMREAFEQVSKRVPFAIKELHPDNGPEFFHWHYGWTNEDKTFIEGLSCWLKSTRHEHYVECFGMGQNVAHIKRREVVERAQVGELCLNALKHFRWLCLR